MDGAWSSTEGRDAAGQAVEAEQVSKSSGPGWGSALRILFGAVLVAILARGAILLSITIFAHSNHWDLPSGAVLERVLASCQVMHVRRAGVDSEQMLCPMRHAPNDFPEVLRDALVASEDRRFFSHSAVDLRSTLRAVWHMTSGDRQGGSTITQQLARSLVLRKEDSFERKLLEAVLAIRIFSVLSREQILTRYMNVVPHARSMHGFDDPARYYFGVPAKDLTLAEAALLVGMLPEPNNRDPNRHPSEAIDGAVSVLMRMQAQQMISAEEAEAAKAQISHRVRNQDLRRGKATYARIEYRPYRDLALREARADGIALGKTYRLSLFIDPEFQKNLVAQLCAIAGGHEAAGFFMRPSGEVLATAGGCRYLGKWNRAADIGRSIGSTGKLFPLIGAHEGGIGLDRRVSTRPLRRSGWPREASSRCVARRSVSLKFALDYSCNRPWAAVAAHLGPRVQEIVGRFGLEPPKTPALVSLGGIYTSPMKLTQAYASLRNGGALPRPRFLAVAIGPKGNVLGVPKPAPETRAMTPATARAVLDDLRGPVRQGTARAANSPHALVFGKTGTSDRNVDALFVGVTQDFAGSLWIGNDNPSPMPGVHGGGAPARAFSKLTDFYYLRLAQARYERSLEQKEEGPLDRFGSYAPREQTIRQLAMLGSMLAASFLLAGLVATRS